LERQTHDTTPDIISLGVFTGYNFYPTMSHDVFEILVKENKFIIFDETKKNYSLEEFQDAIDNTFTGFNPPVISLNQAS
jgi:hypothetical protein